MSFNKDYLARVTSSGNPNTHVIYSYKTSEDTLAQVKGDGYFNAHNIAFRADDIIYVVASDAYQTIIVTASGADTTVTTAEYNESGEVKNFTDLGDVPSSYTTANAVHKIKSGKNGIEESGMTITDAGTVSIPEGEKYQINGEDLSFNDLNGSLNFNNLVGTCSYDQGGTGQTSYVDGELLIGKTVNGLQKGTLTGTTNQITITNGAGSITLSTPQDIATTSDPTFNDLTVASLTSTDLGTDGVVKTTSGLLSSEAQLSVADGGTGQSSYTDGQLLIGNTTGNTLAKATLTGTTDQITVTNGSGTITLATPQDIATTSSPTFSTVTLSDTPLAVGSGGSGQSSYTDGQLLIGNTTGNTLSKATLTAGTGIDITNGSGSITIANSLGGIWTKLTSASASASSTIEFSGTYITSTYKIYLIICYGLYLSSITGMQMRYSSDGGSSWLSGATSYAWVHAKTKTNTGTQTIVNDAGDSSMELTDDLVNSKDPSGRFYMYMYNPVNADYQTVIQHYLVNSTIISWGFSRYTFAASTNGLQFYPDSGTITGGEFTLYGLSSL